MKKYQQLLIVSLGLVSFICFLIYKHEYDRLRNVLEVLEVFGTPPSQNSSPLRSHSGDGNNQGMMAGSINELNLVQDGGNNNYDGNKADLQKQLVDDTFILKNGHGVRPPDNDAGPEDGAKVKPNVIQNPIQTSGEVIDNMIDDGGGGDGVIGKFGAVKAKKAVQRQESIFHEHQKVANNAL